MDERNEIGTDPNVAPFGYETVGMGNPLEDHAKRVVEGAPRHCHQETEGCEETTNQEDPDLWMDPKDPTVQDRKASQTIERSKQRRYVQSFSHVRGRRPTGCIRPTRSNGIETALLRNAWMSAIPRLEGSSQPHKMQRHTFLLHRTPFMRYNGTM